MKDNSAQAQRIHRHGLLDSDFGEVKPNCAIVEPIDPPESLAGLVVAHVTHSKLNGTRYFYRVCKVGPPAPFMLPIPGPGGANLTLLDVSAALLPIAVGDVLFLRNAQLEALDAEGTRFVIDRRHIHAKLSLEDEAPTDVVTPEAQEIVEGA